MESSLRYFSGEYSEQEIFEEEIKTFDFVKNPEGVWSLVHSDFPDDSFDSTVLRKKSRILEGITFQLFMLN